MKDLYSGSYVPAEKTDKALLSGVVFLNYFLFLQWFNCDFPFLYGQNEDEGDLDYLKTDGKAWQKRPPYVLSHLGKSTKATAEPGRQRNKAVS